MSITLNEKNLCICGREKDSQDARCLTCEDQIADVEDDEADAVDNCY